MAGVGLLHRVDRQRADRVDAELVERFDHRAQEPPPRTDLITRRAAALGRVKRVFRRPPTPRAVHLVENPPERLHAPWLNERLPPPPTSVRKPLEWSAGELEGRAAGLEWLETDGLGGFACGTVAGTRTRRYHGWYVPAIPPPRRRWMLVSGVRRVRGRPAARRPGISTQAYRDAEHPDGARTLSRFRLEPFPTWRHETGAFAVERSLCLVRERSLAIVRWVNRGASEITLRVRPLLAFRGSHRLQSETTDWDPAIEVRGEISWVRPVPYLPRLYLRGVFATTQTAPVWYRHFRYAEEAERGYDAEEDLWSPLEWDVDAAAGRARPSRSSRSTRSRPIPSTSSTRSA